MGPSRQAVEHAIHFNCTPLAAEVDFPVSHTATLSHVQGSASELDQVLLRWAATLREWTLGSRLHPSFIRLFLPGVQSCGFGRLGSQGSGTSRHHYPDPLLCPLRWCLARPECITVQYLVDQNPPGILEFRPIFPELSPGEPCAVEPSTTRS